MNYEDLPDTISYKEYAKWRKIGITQAYYLFRSKGFPLLPFQGKKLLADKRAVLMYDLGLDITDRKEIIERITEDMFERNRN